MPCPQCQRPHKRSVNGPCSRCYNAARFKRSAAAYETHKAAVTRYQKQHPDKHAKWARTWQERVGIIVPADVHAVRRAVKRLERALANTSQRTRVRRAGE